ncbi:BMP-binding endothelial regulator protein-like, partial [Saccoglossus kowalevskii]|uniref:IgGFc-binding protein-like n=1 Tax=Saccoglossus kowalevskii TaxID=10224 RepID=A0ABM0GWE3_SACKO
RSTEKRSKDYTFVHTFMNWYDAKADCESRNLKLAEIRTQADQDELLAATMGYSSRYWFGTIDPQGDNTFEYATGESLTYSRFSPGYPTVFNDISCAAIDGYYGYWINANCDNMYPFLCEPDIDSPGVSGDPHMTTFDGRPFSFQGICWHTLFKDCSTNPAFEVTAEFEPREDSTLEHVRTRTVSVNVTVGGDFAIINGLDVVTGRTDGHITAARPIHVHEDDKKITLSFTSKDTTFTLHWTLKKHSLRVSISGSDYRGHLCGLLGDDDGDTRNDFLTPDGAVVNDATVFGESWKVEWKKCD